MFQHVAGIFSGHGLSVELDPPAVGRLVAENGRVVDRLGDGLEGDHMAGREPAFESASGVGDRPPRNGDALASDLHVDNFPERHGGHRQGHGVAVDLYACDAVLAA